MMIWTKNKNIEAKLSSQLYLDSKKYCVCVCVCMWILSFREYEIIFVVWFLCVLGFLGFF